MPAAEFRHEFHSLLCGRARDPAFEEGQVCALTRIELEGRTFGRARLMLDRPDIRSAVAESDREYVAVFGVMREAGSRTKLLASACRELKESLGKALYEEDPAVTGSSVGAPLDEYDAESARLAVTLRNCETKKDVAEALNAMFDGAPDPLVERALAALVRFRAANNPWSGVPIARLRASFPFHNRHSRRTILFSPQNPGGDARPRPAALAKAGRRWSFCDQQK